MILVIGYEQTRNAIYASFFPVREPNAQKQDKYGVCIQKQGMPSFEPPLNSKYFTIAKKNICFYLFA